MITKEYVLPGVRQKVRWKWNVPSSIDWKRLPIWKMSIAQYQMNYTTMKMFRCDVSMLALLLQFFPSAPWDATHFPVATAAVSVTLIMKIYPLVVFYAEPEIAATLLNAAEEAGVGIGHVDGCLMVWANDIRDMLGFAGSLIKTRDEMRKAQRYCKNGGKA